MVNVATDTDNLSSNQDCSVTYTIKNALPKKTKRGRGAEEQRERQDEHKTKQKKEKETKEGRVGNSPGSQPQLIITGG